MTTYLPGDFATLVTDAGVVLAVPDRLPELVALREPAVDALAVVQVLSRGSLADVPDFAAVRVVGAEIRMVVRGPFVVRVNGYAVDGQSAATWAEGSAPLTDDAVVEIMPVGVEPTGQALPLIGGVVRSGGLSWRPGAAGTPAAPGAAADTPGEATPASAEPVEPEPDFAPAQEFTAVRVSPKPAAVTPPTPQPTPQPTPPSAPAQDDTVAPPVRPSAPAPVAPAATPSPLSSPAPLSSPFAAPPTGPPPPPPYVAPAGPVTPTPPPPIAPPGAPVPDPGASWGGDLSFDPSTEHDGRTITPAQLQALRASQSRSTPAAPPVAAPVKALVALELSTGRVVPIRRRVLIGRSPRIQQVGGSANLPALVTVDDPYVSGTHLEVSIDGASVLVTDTSSNGTLIARQGKVPVPLDPGVATEVAVGDVLTLSKGLTATVVPAKEETP